MRIIGFSISSFNKPLKITSGCHRLSSGNTEDSMRKVRVNEQQTAAGRRKGNEDRERTEKKDSEY